MPYGNYFPASYQPYYPQYGYTQPQQMQTVQQPQMQNQQTAQNAPMTSGIIWVQGEAGAKSYLVAPNTTVQLWDSEKQTIYLKSADASGMPSIRTLDYTIREAMPNVAPIASNSVSEAYATKDELQVIAKQMDELRGVLDGLMASKGRTAKPTRKEVTDDE